MLSHVSYSQKIILQQKSTNKHYRHEYWFSLQLRDTLVIQLSWEFDASDNVHYQLECNQSELFGESIFITQVGRDLPQMIIDIDSTGRSFFTMDRFTETLSIDCYYWNPLQVSLKLRDSVTQTTLKFPPIPNDEVYQINSKEELTETELNEIMQCVKNQLKNKDATVECNDRKRYYVSFQI
jgi:hypothetical protein